MKILNSKRHIYLKVIISLMLTMFSISSFAKSYLTFDEFKSLPKKDQLSVLNKIQSVIATVEKKQSILLKRAEAEKFYSNKTSSYEQKVIKLWSLVIAKAYAGDKFTFKGISGDKLCLFAGWPSYKTYSTELGYNVCVHPDRISQISGLSPEKKALGEAYDQFKSKYECSSSHGILCNPTLYGELDYCAPGKDVITALDSSIACWVESKKQDKDEDLLASITDNGELSEDFHGLLKLVFGMCLCQGKYVDTDGKRKRVITEFYSNYAMGHRTCAGLLSQVRKVTSNLSGSCLPLSSNSISNVEQFINNIHSKVDDYLDEQMFTGDGASQAYYENYGPLGFDRTSVELAKNKLRKDATLDDDQYCNGTLYTDDEKKLPEVKVEKEDKGETYHITIGIDFNNSTYNQNEFKLEVITDPDITPKSNENNIYIFEKIDDEIKVNIKYTHIQTNNKIYDSKFSILGKNSADDGIKLVIQEGEKTDSYEDYSYQVFYKNIDITNDVDKYKLEITSSDQDIIDFMTTINEYTRKFIRASSSYDIEFQVIHNKSKSEDKKKLTINKKENSDQSYKINIVEKSKDSDQYVLTYKLLKGEEELNEVPLGHDIKWFKGNEDLTGSVSNKELTLDRKEKSYTVKARLYDSNNQEIAHDEKEIQGKNETPSPSNKYEIKIYKDTKETTETASLKLVAKIYENENENGGGDKKEIDGTPEGHSVQWYRSDKEIDGKNDLTASFKQEAEDYEVAVKLLNDKKKPVSEDSATIEKTEESNDEGEDINISITKNELVEENYQLEATITYKSEEKTEIPEGYSVKWTITSESTDDDDSDADSDDSSDNLLDALDSDEDTTVTKTGTLSINVAQGKLTKVVKVEVLKDDESKSSDSVTLEGTGIDLEEDDDTDRSIGSNKNPYQQQMKPPMSVPRPKMILRGKDGHQGRWGY